MRFTGVRAVTLDAAVFELRVPLPVEGQGDRVTLAFDRCAEVSMTSCHLTGFTLAGADQPPGVLLSITNAGRVLLKDNVFEAALSGVSSPPEAFLQQPALAFWWSCLAYLARVYSRRATSGSRPWSLQNNWRLSVSLNANCCERALQRSTLPV